MEEEPVNEPKKPNPALNALVAAAVLGVIPIYSIAKDIFRCGDPLTPVIFAAVAFAVEFAIAYFIFKRFLSSAGEPPTAKRKVVVSFIATIALFAVTVFISAGSLVPFAHYGVLECCRPCKEDLANLAISQENYFADHETYTGNLSKLPGIAPSSGVAITITRADKDGFAAQAVHEYCDRDSDGKPDVFVWDSANGGLEK